MSLLTASIVLNLRAVQLHFLRLDLANLYMLLIHLVY
jgi:hypothetical protein